VKLSFKPDLFSNRHEKWKHVRKKNDILEIKKILYIYFKKKSIYKISNIKKIDTLGINSNNFFFRFEKKDYVLKKYHKQNTKSLESIGQLMNWLKKKNIPVQKPMSLNNNKFTLDKGNKKWRLIEFIDGKTFTGTMSEFKNASMTIAKMSKIMSKYPKKKLINPVHKYFPKEDYKIINFVEKNLHKLEKYFSKTHSNLLRKNWQTVIENWNYVKDLKIDSGSIQPIHNDLHPHNLIMKNNKLNGILDWEACLNMPVGASLAYAGLKICKQVLIKNRLEKPEEIGGEYKKIIKKYSLLNKQVIDNFFNLSLIEVIRRLCMIFKSAIIKKDNRWNRILPIQLGHLYETHDLFFKNQNKLTVCVIPARGGSKRIKNKNIKNFNGKPLISYSIKTAINSKLFDKIIVSTDSTKIAKIAKKYGATVPFLRPKKLSNDFANDLQVINHYLDYNKKNKILVDCLCYLYATAPLIKVSTLVECHKKIKSSNYPRVMPVTKFNVPIQRALIKNKTGDTDFKNKQFLKYRSQDFEEHYHDAGQCYFYNIKEFTKQKFSLWPKTLGVELKRDEVVDIDTLDDFKMAEKLYKLNKY
jgi:pseudaminic acid cytidylyltransferase